MPLIVLPVPLFLLQKVFKYKISTLLRAQGVVRRNFKLDLRRGLFRKQRIFSNSPILSQPTSFSSSVRICSSFTPCSGSLPLFIGYLKSKNGIVPSFLSNNRLTSFSDKLNVTVTSNLSSPHMSAHRTQGIEFDSVLTSRR